MSAALLDKATGGFSVIMLIRSYIKTVDVNFEIHGAARKRFPCRFTLRRDGVSNRFPLSQTTIDLYSTSLPDSVEHPKQISRDFRRFYCAQKSHLRSKRTYIYHWSSYSNCEV